MLAQERVPTSTPFLIGTRPVSTGSSTLTYCTYRCRTNIDVTPLRYRTSSNANGRVYALSRRTASQLTIPEVAPGNRNVARPSSITIRDSSATVENATRVAPQKRRENETSRNHKSPRTVYTYQTKDSSVPDFSAGSSSKKSSWEHRVCHSAR